MFQPIQSKENDNVRLPFEIDPDPHRCQHKWLGNASLYLNASIYACSFFEMVEFNTVHVLFSLQQDGSTFYIFPRDALTECLTHTIPHKVIFSFFPQGKSPLLDQHVMLYDVSQALLQAIQHVVYPYETKCQHMMELLKRHQEQISHHKSEIAMLPETTPSNQSETHLKIHQDDSSTSSYEDIEEGKKKSIGKQVTTKKCLYCGSKSTPMWRRGPQGAGTLCNACGVKWKHGKILNESHTKPEKKRKRSNSKHKEDHSETSSTSDSPSPNMSPAKSIYMAYRMAFDHDDMLEDAVEAAALLTLLKRS